MTAILDDGSNFSCDLNDVRGVVLDEPPLIKEVRAGTKIIALFKEGEPFRSGVVKKILESPDKSAPNVLVKFATKDEEVRPFEYIRLLKHVKSGGKVLLFDLRYIFR